MSRAIKLEALRDQWQVFRAEWGYHLFFWLFLSFMAALIAAGKLETEESVVPETRKNEHTLFPMSQLENS